jgi:hypothetical protein
MESAASVAPLHFHGKSGHADIIQWEEAMMQCGDDEEFLRELLGDLRQELRNQVMIIFNVFQVRSLPSPAETAAKGCRGGNMVCCVRSRNPCDVQQSSFAPG